MPMTCILTTLMLAMSGADDELISLTEAPAFEEIHKIDVHAHYFDDMPRFADMLRRINMRVVNICFYQTQPALLTGAQTLAAMLSRKYADTFYYASTFDLTRRNEPDYAEQVNAWLDRTFANGALMVKIWKEAGMQEKTPGGDYLMPDDPALDPVYAHLTQRGKPLLAHLADPIDAWLPLDASSPHFNYYSNNPQWHVHGREGFPSHARIIAARDNILAKHPNLVVIGAHLGSLEHDLDALADRLDRHPNFHVDVAARTYVLKGMPSEKVRAFFTKYQDRILYGTDLGRYSDGRAIDEKEQIAYAESIEKTYRADYAYYAGGGPKGLALSREILEKFYAGNAERLIPGLRRSP